MSRRYVLAYSAFLIGVYLLLTSAPLIVLLAAHPPPGRGFWRELAVAFGFAGLSVMGWQFFLTGRFQSITSPYGIDVIYHFHRAIALFGMVLIVLHPAILVVSSPATLRFLNPLSAPWWMTAGTGGILAFAVVIVTSVYRIRLGIRYETWRIVHMYASVAAVASATAHIVGVSYYVQEPLKRWLWVSMLAVWILALMHVRILKPLLMLRRPYRVQRVVKERGTSWTLVLEPEGHSGMDFQPGQFGWLTLGKSPFAVRQHPFSFSSSAMTPGRLEMTIKELGDFTATIGAVAPGTRAYVDGPYGTFTIDRHGAPGYVIVAGGVGISPIMSILRTMADRRDTRPSLLFYGSRTWDDATFRDELERLAESLKLRIVHILEEPPDGWSGERGFISADVMARHLPEDRLDCEYFVCGPPQMQAAVTVALGKLGLPLERVQSETFNYV